MGYQAHRNDEDDEKQAEYERAKQNNADTLRNASDVAMASGNPYAMAAGAAVKAADKITGGKSSEMIGGAVAKTNQHAPGGKMLQGGLNALNESGAGDAIGTAASAKSGGGAGAAEKGAKVAEGAEKGAKAAEAAEKGAKAVEGAEKGAKNADLINKNAKGAENASEKVAEAADKAPSGGGSGDGTASTSEPKDNSKLITVGLPAIIFGPLILMMLVILLSAVTKLAPIFAAYNYVKGKWNDFTDYVTNAVNHSKEEKYYKKLKQIKNKYKNKGVCIDINLITSSLTANLAFDDLIEEDDDVEDDDENAEYGIMRKKIEWLAAMQITHKYYVVPEESNKCVEGGSEKIVKSGEYDSSTAELIASHDERNAVARFFKSKPNEERNYIYHYYYPDYERDQNGNYKTDRNGNKVCSDSYVKNAVKNKNNNVEKTAAVNIGSEDEMEDSVFFWNLNNSFIPEYYKDDLEGLTEEEQHKKVVQMAIQAYSLYKMAGNGQNCYNNGGAVISFGSSDLCPDGVIVVDKNKNVEAVVPLEEYVAGVITHEAYVNEGMEALKAQAVAARTYVLNKTGNCQTTIENSTNAQTFSANPAERAKEAAAATAGEVLKYNGSMESFKGHSMYDAFCYADNDCPDAKKNGDGSYSVTYTKVPSTDKHVITLTDKLQISRIPSGQGHSQGMSQLLSYEMASKGMDYKEILQYFYADGTIIESDSQNNSGVMNSGYGPSMGVTGDWANWKQYKGDWEGLYIDSKTIHQVGCTLTSVAIQIARSEVQTYVDGEFNPGTFMEAHKANGGFTKCGDSGKKNCFIWNVEDVAPQFKYKGSVSSNNSTVARDALSYSQQGYYVIIYITYIGGDGEIHYHYVALNYSDGENVFMFDPGSIYTDLFQYKGLQVQSLHLYYVDD